MPPSQPANLRSVKSLQRDFVLHEGPLVTVRVRDAENGKPVEGLAVSSDRFGTGGPPLGRTGRDGSYSWRSNTLEFTIELGTMADSKEREAFGAAPGYAFYKQVKLTSAVPFLWETKAYQEPFAQKTTTFRGVVVDETGAPVAGAHVAMFQYGERSNAAADASGRFEIQGRRILNFGDRHQDDIVLSVDGNDRSATVRPKAEETWGEMRIVVRPNALARATGRVMDDQGRPVPSMPVSVSEYFGGDNSSHRLAPTITDSEGRFALGRLRPGGAYIVFLGGGDWGTTEIPSDWRKGYELQFVAGEVRDLGTAVVPRARSLLAGMVVAPDGKPVKGRYGLHLVGEHTDLPILVDAAGRFKVNVVDEPLVMSVYASDAQGITRTGDDSPDRLLRQRVAPGDQHVRLVVKWRPAKP